MSNFALALFIGALFSIVPLSSQWQSLRPVTPENADCNYPADTFTFAFVSVIAFDPVTGMPVAFIKNDQVLHLSEPAYCKDEGHKERILCIKFNTAGSPPIIPHLQHVLIITAKSFDDFSELFHSCKIYFQTSHPPVPLSMYAYDALLLRMNMYNPPSQPLIGYIHILFPPDYDIGNEMLVLDICPRGGKNPPVEDIITLRPLSEMPAS